MHIRDSQRWTSSIRHQQRRPWRNWNKFSPLTVSRVVRSDNGPPFTSHEFKSFMEEHGVDHQRITPLWPQANSEAENFMKPLTKSIRSSRANGKRDIHRFLLNYRATPHTTTGFASSELLFNRVIKTKLPQVVVKQNNDTVRAKDHLAKDKMKKDADTRRRAIQNSIQIGDMVLLKQINSQRSLIQHPFVLHARKEP